MGISGKYKMKQIPKMDILYSRYSRKNKKTTESVIFRLYSKDNCQTNRLYYKQAVLYTANSIKVVFPKAQTVKYERSGDDGLLSM